MGLGCQRHPWEVFLCRGGALRGHSCWGRESRAFFKAGKDLTRFIGPRERGEREKGPLMKGLRQSPAAGVGHRLGGACGGGLRFGGPEMSRGLPT